MTSQKPYLVRAIYSWLLDNNFTPYLLVSTEYEGVQVPEDYINNDKIILNVAPDAVKNFHTDNEWISFSARFSGKPMELFVPMVAVQAIYSKENNEGMFFSDETTSSPPPVSTPTDTRARPSLKVVK